MPAPSRPVLTPSTVEAGPNAEPFFESSERFALAPHLPVEKAPARRRRRSMGNIGARERSDVRLAADVVAFAVVAALVLIGTLTWFGPAGFIGWLLVAVPVLWFGLVDPHMRARYR